MVLAGSVEALKDAGDGGDLVEAEHRPRQVGQHEHDKDDHHYHRHSDISPIFRGLRKLVLMCFFLLKSHLKISFTSFCSEY